MKRHELAFYPLPFMDEPRRHAGTCPGRAKHARPVTPPLGGSAPSLHETGNEGYARPWALREIASARPWQPGDLRSLGSSAGEPAQIAIGFGLRFMRKIDAWLHRAKHE